MNNDPIKKTPSACVTIIEETSDESHFALRIQQPSLIHHQNFFLFSNITQYLIIYEEN